MTSRRGSQASNSNSNYSKPSSNHSTRRNSNSNNNTGGRGSVKRFLPPDPRPSRSDPEQRRHRLNKEKESGGFDWTPGIVLALIGATAFFSVERSLFRRRKKEYIG